MMLFVKDPATADSLVASATVLNTATPTFTRTTGAYNPATDAIVGAAVRRYRTQVVGTTSLSSDLIELTRANLLASGTSERFDRWTAANGLTVTADTTAAPNGEVIAQTLTDPGSSLSSAQQTFVVANDSLTHCFTIYVLKTAGGTAPTFGVTLALTGGTPVTTNARINTDNGTQQYGSNANTSIETPANTAWWRVIVMVTNNTSGNTTLTLDVYPAAAAYGASVDSAAATGTAICTGADLHKVAVPTAYNSNRNVLLNTETLNSSWTKTRITITSDSTANPLDSTVNADTIVDDNTAANTHLLSQNFTKAAAAIQFTFSTYIKQSGCTWAFVQLSDTGITNGAGIYFDVANGAKGTAVALGVGWTLDASTITAVGSWYRCTITVTTDTAVSIKSEIYTATGDLLAIHNGINAAALICWGNQLVYGAKAMSYWSTAGTVGNRTAESLQSTTAVSITTGTIIGIIRPYGWSGTLPESTGTTAFIASSPTNSDVLWQLTSSTTTTLARADAGGIGSNVVTATTAITNGINTIIGMTWGSAAVTGYVAGSTNGTPDMSLTPPYNGPTSLFLGSLSVNSRECCSFVLFFYWPSVLPPSSMQIFANGVAA